VRGVLPCERRVQEKEYHAIIPVVFDGGKGEYLVKSAQVTLYRSDGQVITKALGIRKGDLVNYGKPHRPIVLWCMSPR
jgi:hypothetical protein